MRGILKVSLGLLIFLLVDAAVFRSGWYGRYLESNSSAGIVALTVERARLQQREWAEPLVLTMGDSRMNFPLKKTNEYAAGKGYRFRISHGGVAGTNPRVWYYLLREMDPTARRYRAIVLPVDGFDDEDTYQNYANYPLDVNYLAMLLRWSDAPEYPRSYADWKYEQEAWKACLVKSAALQRDLLAFFEAPRVRLEMTKLNREWWPKGSYEFEEEEKTLAGLEVDWKTRTAKVPAGADPEVIKTVLLRPDAPQTGRYGAYRRKWFGKILDRYAGTGTKLVFVMLPRGPVVRPAVKTVSSSIREFGGAGRAVVGEEHRYEELERPEMFKDGLHLNRAGARRYGELLVEELARVLGAV